jgi:hypothetical protein
MKRLRPIEKKMLASPDQQSSLMDPDSHSMTTSGRGSGVVGYNVQVAVDAEHHLISARGPQYRHGPGATCQHGFASQGSSRCRALEAVADRDYFDGPKVLACEQANTTVTLPEAMTSGSKSKGRSVSRTSFICRPRMSIAAQRVRS